MIIEFKTSPSNFVILSCNVSHLQAFKVRHSKIPSICIRGRVSARYGHHKHEYKLKPFWALTRSSRPYVVVEYPANPESEVVQSVGGSEA